MKKIGFIGMGNMAQALAKGFLKAGALDPENIFAYAPNQEKLRKNSEDIGFVACSSPKALVESCDIVFAACKPYQIESVFGEIREAVKEKPIVSVAAGWSYEKFTAFMGDEAKFQYILPNTPVAVCKGVILAERANGLAPEDRAYVLELLSNVSNVIEMDAHLIGAASSVSGCGPAFIAVVIEALADGAVKNGVPRSQAYELVSSMIMGAAALQLETGIHPGELKDGVCSPGGSTIRGVAALEDGGVRSAFIKAVDASIN